MSTKYILAPLLLVGLSTAVRSIQYPPHHHPDGYPPQYQFGPPQHYGFPPSPGSIPHSQPNYGSSPVYHESCCLNYNEFKGYGYNTPTALYGTTLFDLEVSCPTVKSDKDICSAAAVKYGLDHTALAPLKSLYGSIASGHPSFFTSKATTALALTDDGTRCFNVFPDVKKGQRLPTLCNAFDTQLPFPSIATVGAFYSTDALSVDFPILVGGTLQGDVTLDGRSTANSNLYFGGELQFPELEGSNNIIQDSDGQAVDIGPFTPEARFQVYNRLSVDEVAAMNNMISAQVCSLSQQLSNLKENGTVEVTNSSPSDRSSTITIKCSTQICVVKLEDTQIPLDTTLTVVFDLSGTETVILNSLNISWPDVETTFEDNQLVGEDFDLIINYPAATEINLNLTGTSGKGILVAPVATTVSASTEPGLATWQGGFLLGNESSTLNLSNIDILTAPSFQLLPLKSKDIHVTYCKCLCPEEHTYDDNNYDSGHQNQPDTPYFPNHQNLRY